MNIVASSEPLVQDVRVTEDEIIAYLADGRVISVPLAWSWRLSQATPAQRANWRLIGTGQGVHWPDVDEDLAPRGCFTAFLHTVRLRRQHSTKDAGASQQTKASLRGAEALNLGDLRTEPSDGQDDHGKG